MVVTKANNVLATKLQRIALRTVAKPSEKFNKLMPLFTKENLIQCFHELKEGRATGIDRLTKEEYAANLGTNVEKLIVEMKTMSYRPQPVRESLIPKDDGEFRPLGISTVEDKIIQLMYAKILETIFEPHFRDCSYGFRPGRNCHQAIKSVDAYISNRWSPVVIDADLKNYFGTIDHNQLLEFIRNRIDDERFLRYLVRILKAGILRQGVFALTDEGSPQGAICSPVLSNIYAHYVLDEWVEDVVVKHCPGIRLVRYCDDFVICCPDEKTASSIYAVLDKRLDKFKLKLHETKTKLVFMNKKKFQQGVAQGTFSFLGFTFYLAKSKTGRTVPKVKTDRKKFKKKLKEIGDWVKSRRNENFTETWKLLNIKLGGYARYYGVSNNLHNVTRFIYLATKIFFKWMNRRSQRRSMTWEKFEKFLKLYPPFSPRIYVNLFLNPGM